MERRTQALAFPTSVLISLMFWMCLRMKGEIDELRRDYRGWDHLLLYFNYVKIEGFFGDGNESN